MNADQDKKLNDEALASTLPSSHRPIRSFVLRQGRLSTGQSRAVENIGPRLVIPYTPTVLDYESVFGRVAPTIVEIGFGMGHTTADIAQSLLMADWPTIACRRDRSEKEWRYAIFDFSSYAG